MKKVFTSASKLAFIMLITTTCIGFIIDKVPVELFGGVVMAACGAYFVQNQHNGHSDQKS